MKVPALNSDKGKVKQRSEPCKSKGTRNSPELVRKMLSCQIGSQTQLMPLMDIQNATLVLKNFGYMKKVLVLTEI